MLSTKVVRFLHVFSSRLQIRSQMSSQSNYVFKQQYNVLKGCMEWCPTVEDYDYHQEIARSAYADMLHDSDRNALYRLAIEKSVKKLLTDKPKQEVIRVLDIGTGTGLLSMIAARAFGVQRDRVNVTAYECFLPMADCAEKVIATNGFSKLINVVKKRSNEDMTDIDQKADLLVTEVFDTELIGEGALGTYRFALQNQLKPGALTVPYKARIWIQLISSKWLHSGNQFNNITLRNKSTVIYPPKNALNCVGSNHLHDLQLNELQLNNDFSVVSAPKIIFEFNFSDINSLKLFDERKLSFEMINDVDDHLMVAMWWDLFMDWEEEIVLSCAPYWANPLKSRGKLPWRDHWIQSIYYLPANLGPFRLRTGEKLSITGYHDEYSLWFDVKDGVSNSHRCSCDLHSQIVRSRLRMMNNTDTLNLYFEAISKLDVKNILFIGDASLIPIMISKSFPNIDSIYCLTNGNDHNVKFYKEFIDANKVNINLVSTVDELASIKMDLIVAEPYFNNIDLPWDCLQFWYTLTRLPQHLYDKNNLKLLPFKAVIKAIPVEFDDLWKIRAKVETAEEFDLSDFDNLVLNAMHKSDPTIESQPLWEYPARALIDEPLSVFEWDLSNFDLTKQESEFSATVNYDPKLLNHKRNTISLVFWVDFHLTDDEKITTGAIGVIKSGEYISWNRDWKQGVAFLFAISEETKRFEYNSMSFDVKYDFSDGTMKLSLN